MLTDKELDEIRDELDHCKRPVYLFHDDPDGICSFLLFYRYMHEGKGIIVKTHPQITEMFARKVEEYGADKVFILDIAIVDQEFIDYVNIPVVWIDHHNVLERDRVKYYNPRKNGNNIPPSYICYKVVKQDLWISMAGCIGDWYMPDFKDEFCEKYPDLLDKNVTEVSKALFDSKIGLLTRILAFNLKESTQEAMKSAKVLTRIDSPYEILDQKTSKGKYIFKKYLKIKRFYDVLLQKALMYKTKDKMMIFTYRENKISLTKELANELLYKFPDKLIIGGRENSGEFKCSIRSGENLEIPAALEKALVGVEGYGGGHEHACGACIKSEDFKRFVSNLKKELNL